MNPVISLGHARLATASWRESKIPKMLFKRVISKTHGIGKATKEKPSSILEKAKDLYDKVGQEIQELKIELT